MALFTRSKAVSERGARRWPRPVWNTVFALVLMSLIIHSLAMMTLGRSLEDRLAALKAQGEPLSCSEVAPPAVPDVENGAVVYAAIFKRFDTPDFRKDELALADLLGPTRRWHNPLVWKTAEKTLARYRDLPGQVERAEARPACRFPVNWASGFSALLPHLPHMKQCARLLSADALLCAHDGRHNEAIHLITLVARMESAIRDEPCLISQLVRMSVVNQACSLAAELVRPQDASGAAVGELAQTLDRVDLAPALVRATECERAAGLAIYQLVRSQPETTAALLSGPGENGEKKFAATRLVGNYLWRPFLYSDEMAYLRCMDRQIHTMPLPWRSRAEGDDLRDVPNFAIVTRILVPASSNFVRKRDMALAQISGARIFLALQACKARTGTYPASLEALSGTPGVQVPEDPFSGKGFQYRRQGRGFLLYSIGPNFKDDAGEGPPARRPLNSSDPDDIVWRQG